MFTRCTKEFRAAEHHRLAGSCLVITHQKTGTTAILVVSKREVDARLGNIRSRKNTKCFVDYSRRIDDSTSAQRLQIIPRSKQLHQVKVTQDNCLFTSKPRYIVTTLIVSTHKKNFYYVKRIFHFSLYHSYC